MISAASILSADGLRRWATDELTAPERILLGLRWFDWATSSEIYDALDLSEHDRRNYSAHLSRMIKRGDLEARGNGTSREYRVARRET
jgi:hypothetical protein